MAELASSGTAFVDLLRLPEASPQFHLPPIKSPRTEQLQGTLNATQPSRHSTNSWRHGVPSRSTNSPELDQTCRDVSAGVAEVANTVSERLDQPAHHVPDVAEHMWNRVDAEGFRLQDRSTKTAAMSDFVQSRDVQSAEVAEALDKALVERAALQQQLKQLRGENHELACSVHSLTTQVLEARRSLVIKKMGDAGQDRLLKDATPWHSSQLQRTEAEKGIGHLQKTIKLEQGQAERTLQQLQQQLECRQVDEHHIIHLVDQCQRELEDTQAQISATQAALAKLATAQQERQSNLGPFGMFERDGEPVINLDRLELDIDGINSLPPPMRTSYLQQLGSYYEQLSALTQQLKTTMVATSEFNRSLDLFETQEWINNRTAEMLNSLAARILILDWDNRIFWCMVMDQDGVKHEKRFRMEDGLTLQSLQKGPGNVAVFQHIETESSAALPDCDHYYNYPLRSLLVGVIPSSHDPSQATGVMQVFNKYHEQQFTNTDLFIFKYILQQAAVAMDNAQMQRHQQQLGHSLVALQELAAQCFRLTAPKDIVELLCGSSKKLLNAHRVQVTLLDRPIERSAAQQFPSLPTPQRPSTPLGGEQGEGAAGAPGSSEPAGDAEDQQPTVSADADGTPHAEAAKLLAGAGAAVTQLDSSAPSVRASASGEIGKSPRKSTFGDGQRDHNPKSRRSSMSAYTKYQQVTPLTPLVQEALRRGNGLTIVDAHEDSRFDRESDDASGFRSLRLMIQPIYDTRGWVLGAVTVTRGWAHLNEPEIVWKDPSMDVFGKNDIEICQMLCQQVGIALENAKLCGSLDSLPQLLTDVPGGLTLGEASARIVAAIMQICPCEEVRLLVPTEHFDMYMEACDTPGATHLLSGLMATAFLRGQPVKAYRREPGGGPQVFVGSSQQPSNPSGPSSGGADSSLDPMLADPPNLAQPYVSLMLVPITDTSKAPAAVVAVIQLVNRLERPMFGRSDDLLIRGVASQASVLLQTAALQTDLIHSQAQLGGLLQFASDLTRSTPLDSRDKLERFSAWMLGAVARMVPGSAAGVAWWDCSRAKLLGIQPGQTSLADLPDDHPGHAALRQGAAVRESAWGELRGTEVHKPVISQGLGPLGVVSLYKKEDGPGVPDFQDSEVLLVRQAIGHLVTFLELTGGIKLK